jgi:hypothetical protein
VNQFGDAYKKLEALGDRERPVMDYEQAGRVAYAEQRVVEFRAHPTMEEFAAHPTGEYARLTRPSLPVVAEPAKGEDWAADDDAHMDGHARMILGAEPAAGAQPCDGDHPEPNCGAKDCWHNDPLQPAGSGEIELDLKAVNELSQLDKVTLAVRLFRAEAALRSKQGERNE